MKYYGRMEIMSMSDGEIEKTLREEGDSLPEGVAAMLLDELEKRKEAPESVDLGISEEELAELNAEEDSEEETGEDDTDEPDEPDEPDETDDGDEDGDGDEENGGSSAPGERSNEEKIADLEKEIDERNKESKKILIVSTVAAVAVAGAAIAVLLILKALGKL